MRSTRILMLAGVSTASARGVYERFMAPGPTPIVVKRDEAECSSAIVEIMPLFSDVPMPDPELLEYIEEEFATITDPCEMPTFAPGMEDRYSSWLGEMESYYYDMADEVSSILAACTDVPGIEDQFDYNPEDICDNGGGSPPGDDDDDDDSLSPTESEDETPTETDEPTAETEESETATGTGEPAAETSEPETDDDDDSGASRESVTILMGGLMMTALVVVGIL